MLQSWVDRVSSCYSLPKSPKLAPKRQNCQEFTVTTLLSSIYIRIVRLPYPTSTPTDTPVSRLVPRKRKETPCPGHPATSFQRQKHSNLLKTDILRIAIVRISDPFEFKSRGKLRFNEPAHIPGLYRKARIGYIKTAHRD